MIFKILNVTYLKILNLTKLSCCRVLGKTMKSKKLEELLTQNLQYFIKHWKNTSHQGELDNKLILSVSDGYERAKVITPIISHNDILEEGGKAVLKLLLNKLEWAASKFDNPLKWLRLEWINKERKFTWKEFNKDLRGYKRNYYRSGIAYKGNTKPWCLLTEMELNANACLYMGGEVPYAKVNYKNLNKYIKSRHSSNNIPSFDSEMELIVFQTSGIFFDAQMNDVEILCTLPRRHGSREISSLTPKITSDLINKTTLYLANQVKPSGRFEYGHFPCFGRNINTYNTLRHASSVYSLIEGYSFCREHQLDTQNLRFIAQQIELALTYLEENVIKHYSDDKSYVLEINNTIKLGANAVCILALVKYMQVFKESEHNSRFLKLSRNLANGILAMQKTSGQFVHVLNADTLEVISENHVIYYDGEAVFGLMRLYGIDKDERLIDCVERAFDYFIESEAGHNGAHDHWLSYCTNEMVIYRPERKYFQFAVNNVKGFTDFIKNRITTYPTLLELSMAFHKMLLKLDEYPEHKSVLEGFDVKDFYEALHARANYLVNGFFFPEMAMFYKKPDTILNGCFIRHHAFRVRIDDVQHYLSGWVAYHSLLSGQSYPKSVNQTNRKFIEGDQVLTPLALEEATGGRWLIRPKKGWTATGLCIHPGGFKKGCLLVARGKNMEKGYLPKVAVKSFTLKGAGAIVTDDYEEYVDFGVPVLLVPNVRKATIDIGKWSRKYFRGDVIGVTGSAGKTTTVAMLSHALQMQVEIDQTKGSANLPIGIAWNMASMSQTAKTWVLELSIGNMALNTQLAQPNIAIVTNIAAAHLEYHNTLDMVAIKKSRIFEAMNPNELAIICRDIEQYELISEKAKEHGLTIISYGEHEKSDIRLIDYAPNIAKISLRGKIHMLEMSSIGKHMVLNAMAVLGVADHKSLDISKVINQLNSFSAIEGRGEVSKMSFKGKKVTVYNEAYNANPLSMKAALKAFSEVNVPAANKLVILGDMLELGVNSQKYHLELAKDIKNIDFRKIILVGGLVLELAKELKKLDKVVYYFENKSLLAAQLSNIINDGDSILIKASNSVGLHTLLSENKDKIKPSNVINELTGQAAFVVQKFILKNSKITERRTLVSVKANEAKVPASLAKLLTVMMVWDKLKKDKIDPFKTVIKMPIDLLPGSNEAYKVFEKNEAIPIIELIKAALIISSNESAYALGLWHSGTEKKFVIEMNKKSINLGLEKTHWASSSGLSSKAYSTANDLLKVAESFISDYSEVSKYCSLRSFKKGKKILINTNRLIHQDKRVKGLKTGNIVGIGSSLINYWIDEKSHYLSVVLCSENRKTCFTLSEYAMSSCNQDLIQNVAENKLFEDISIEASVLIAEYESKNGSLINKKILKTINDNKIKPSIGLAKVVTAMLVMDKIRDEGLDINTTQISAPNNLSEKFDSHIFHDLEKIALIDLISVMIISGSNDAAYILACWHSGDESSFIEKMNSKSSQLKLMDTYWASCSGLTRNSYTTLNDSLKLMEEFIQRYSEVSSMCKKKQYTYKGSVINNSNSLVYKFDDVEGVNFSSLKGIGVNLVSNWVRDNKNYISIVLGAANRKECIELSERIIIESMNK